ncbi:MAG: hypothetical protein GWN00_12785 [Aliifodinibius sp.]|nr:hypothetical protein [Fodinibius sp.]NIV12004.1 hypothetical protein [Fodinibius sp.]NIY25649.1 hypothetical protein [Fodinibius sp.]
MARLDGGIFSRPRGKTANIVFGAARTREGKVVTARELVPPSNPNTAEQQTQRNKFKESLEIVRKIGKSIYGSDFNRAVSQLPGFQGMMSVLMNNMSDSFVLSAPSDLNLGTLHYPDTTSLNTAGTSGDYEFTYTNEVGQNGTIADTLVIVSIAAAPGATPIDRKVLVNTSNDRDSSPVTIGPFDAGVDVISLAYFRGEGAAAGLLSTATFGSVTVGS